jgi:hypothetical protein
MILNIDQATKKLKKQYTEGRLIPFIGAGFSYPLDLPSWRQLIVSCGNKLGYEDDLFLLHGNYLQLAEYAKLEGGKNWDVFMQAIRVGFDSKESNEKRKKSEQHRLLAEMELDTIYTTNYDRHIELSFDDNHKTAKTIVSIKDFIEEDNEEASIEVVKFHGCVLKEETIILTESQYNERLKLENPLDQRLRSDALSNSFLFIGYGFDDPNIRYIWYKINQMIKGYTDSGSIIEPRPSFIAAFGYNEVQARILEELNIHVIALDPENKEEQICKLLKEINS